MTGDAVARTDLISIDIARAFAQLTVLAVHLRIAIVSRSASLATGAVVSRQAVTADLIALVIHFAAGGKVVGGDRQRARTNQTIRRCSHCSVTVIALFTKLTMVAGGAIFAILRNIREREL